MSDPLAHLLDEIDAAAAGMPQGPYWVGVHDRRIPEPDNHFVHSESDLVALEMTAPHAAYFAALDPQVVQALVECARVIAEWGTPGDTIEQRASYAEAHEDAYQRLRHLAAERTGGVASE